MNQKEQFEICTDSSVLLIGQQNLVNSDPSRLQFYTLRPGKKNHFI